MSQQFEKWISNKNFEIFDKINEISNKESNDSIVFNNDLLKTSDIRVFHSKRSIIESMIANKINESPISNANNAVIKWFNDFKLRKQFLQKFQHLLIKSKEVLELFEMIFSKTTLKVSRNRVENLVKTLNYAINYQIFNYSNETEFKAIDYSMIKFSDSKSFLLKVINELIGCLVSGIPVVLIAEDRIAITVSYLLDLCQNAGLESGIVQMIINDNKTMEKLNETTEPIIAPIFVAFESADIGSAIYRITNSYINDTIDSINVFVQQSVYTKFCQQMKTHLKNAFEIGDQFEPNVDIVSTISVNYEAIDFDNENNLFGIQIFKFRTNDEMKSLINHFTSIPFISLWTEKTSLALEFGRVIDSSSDIYINSSMKFPTKINISLLDKTSNKTDVNLFSENKNKSFDSLLNSQKKWKSISEEERKRVIKNFITYESKVCVNESVLEVYNQRIAENIDENGIQLMISHFEPIGLIGLKIEGEFNERTFSLVLEALISGNSVLINSAKPFAELVELKEYLSSLDTNILCLMDINDREVLSNSILTFGGISVGLYLQEFNNISRKSFLKFKKSITLSIGDISYAK